jgi:hypothetical protein
VGWLRNLEQTRKTKKWLIYKSILISKNIGVRSIESFMIFFDKRMNRLSRDLLTIAQNRVDEINALLTTQASARHQILEVVRRYAVPINARQPKPGISIGSWIAWAGISISRQPGVAHRTAEQEGLRLSGELPPQGRPWDQDVQ